MPILSANRIGGVRKDIHQPKLGASTLEWVLFLCIVIIPLYVKCFKRFKHKIFGYSFNYLIKLNFTFIKIGSFQQRICFMPVLIAFCAIILRIIAESFHDIFAASCTMFCVKYFAQVIIRIGVNHHSAVISYTSHQWLQCSGLNAGYDFLVLPESFTEYQPDRLLQFFTDHFKQNYGTECIAVLHHNKRKTKQNVFALHRN